MITSIKRRTYEILFTTRDHDRIATFVFMSIFTLILVNVVVGIIETDVHARIAINTAFGFEDSITAHDHTGTFFWWFELVSVLVFTVEYVLRIWSCTVGAEYDGWRGRLKLMTEPLLIVDFVAIAPFYLTLLLGPVVDLRFVRALRLFRIFRIFRAGKLASSFVILANVLKSKREELTVSVLVVTIMVVLSASVMFIVEQGADPDNPDHFHSVPEAMWWAIITVTTIGYGDTFPITTVGKVIGAFIGFLGICAFALPVGIIGAGFVEETERRQAQEEEDQDDRLHTSSGGGEPGGGAPHFSSMGEGAGRFRHHR